MATSVPLGARHRLGSSASRPVAWRQLVADQGHGSVALRLTGQVVRTLATAMANKRGRGQLPADRTFSGKFLSVVAATVLNVRILGYARRSTDEQPTTLDVQVEALTRWAATGEHELLEVAVETVSGGTEPEDREVLSGLLDRLAVHEADALAVTTTDRLARSNAVHRLDYYGDREGWAVVILDVPIGGWTPRAGCCTGSG